MKQIDDLTDKDFLELEKEFSKARGMLSPEEAELFDDLMLNSPPTEGVKKLLFAFVENEQQMKEDQISQDVFLSVIRRVLSTHVHSVERAAKCRQEILALLDKYALRTIGIAGSTLLSAYVDIIERSLDKEDRAFFALEQLNFALREIEEPNDKQMTLFD